MKPTATTSLSLISLAQKGLCDAGTDLMVRDAHSDDDCWTFTGPVKCTELYQRKPYLFLICLNGLLYLGVPQGSIIGPAVV